MSDKGEENMIQHISRGFDDFRILFRSFVIVSQTDDRHCIVAYRGNLYQAEWDARQGQYVLKTIAWKA